MKQMNLDKYVKKEKLLIDLEYKLIETLINIRKEKHLSQRDLCKMIDMKQPYLVKIENKKVSPNLNTILKILDALDCNLEIKSN